ncbi:class I SAM-dependent methyltransferase [Halomarina pelagica]|uniref:class I SAM-dependent methyltransferase n=1 Tax=Halomarina pelagica TaxID=2961599 RepID=UPI0020C4E46C|nr:class I SAM-dependent methyltransferase [Halomarina sp. BND7]
MVNKDAVRRGYDELADVHAAQRTENDRGMEILAGVLDSLSAGTHVLDAGCGQGTPVLSELSTSATATGVDFSRGQLRLAAENAPCASLVQGDMTTLPFNSSSFDAVVAYWSLIHVPMADHRTVVDEFARVLRPGGRLLVCEGTHEWVGENPDWLDSGVRMEWEIAGAETTGDQLRDAGFAVVDTWGVPSSLEADRRSEEEDAPWTFFSARLDA